MTSCVAHAVNVLHLLLSEFTVFAKFISFVDVSFLFFFSVSHAFFAINNGDTFLKDPKIYLVLFVCCNMQWQYKEL